MKKYLDYIQNAGNPTIDEFMEDWEPIGGDIIKRLLGLELIVVRDGRMYLAE